LFFNVERKYLKYKSRRLIDILSCKKNSYEGGSLLWVLKIKRILRNITKKIVPAFVR